ncbi:MAG: hypothetical protein CMH54_13100 [Myxococcales bacterium]|nr:hypothetical protein [Myxococcales bacterium]|tara:strand:+ start:1730 stop:2152 length:423 start_codon:yes stop_codon:yes gene_type:complete
MMHPNLEAVADGQTRRQLARRMHPQQGMTLIEILVVLAIIGMVMGGLVFAYGALFADSQEDVARAQVTTIGNILQTRCNSPRGLPESLENLSALKKSQLKDPWKQEWHYDSSADCDEIVFCSNGKDKKQGSGDDICFAEE